MNRFQSEHLRGGLHPRFVGLWPATGGMALFAEFAHFIVDFPDVDWLSPNRIVPDSDHDAARVGRFKRHLAELTRSEIWVGPESECEAQVYLRPDFSSNATPAASMNSDEYWWCLSHQDQHGLARALAESVGYASGVAIVVVDDYLDPRLATFDRHFRSRGQAWLLIRISGKHPIQHHPQLQPLRHLCQWYRRQWGDCQLQ